MWKLLSDAPSYEDAYGTLYEHYSDAGSDNPADRVLSTWLLAVPHSTAARLLEAARQFRAGRIEAGSRLRHPAAGIESVSWLKRDDPSNDCSSCERASSQM